LLQEVDLPDATTTYHVVYRRSYNSLSSVDGIVGKRWVLSPSPQVFITQPGTTATIHGPGGFVVDMDANGDGTYTAIDGFDGALTRAPDGTYTLTRASTQEQFMFDSQGVPGRRHALHVRHGRAPDLRQLSRRNQRRSNEWGPRGSMSSGRVPVARDRRRWARPGH
jgi:hypothetical protein